MNPFLFTATAAAIVLLFSVAVAFLFRQKTDDPLVRQFIFYLLACILWLGGNAWADIATTEESAFLASGLAFIGGSFIASYFLIFIYTFIEKKPPTGWRLFFYLQPGILLALAAFTPLAIVDVVLEPGAPSYVIPGPAYPTALALLFLIIIYGCIRLYSAYKKSDTLRKKQISYIAIGFMGVFLGQLIFTLILPVLGEFRFYNVAPQFTLVFAIMSGMAIFRYQLLDIRVVVQRGLIYTILFSFITLIYVGVINFTNIFFDQEDVIDDFLSGLLTSIIGIITVPRLDRYLRRSTDKLFFKDKYEYSEALHLLSNTLHSSLNLDALLEACETELRNILRAEYITITQKEYTSGERDTIIPIKLSGKLQGVIIVGPKRSGEEYTERDLMLLETFAAQAATAISRVFLYQEVKRRAEELETMVDARTAELRKTQESQKAMMLHISHNLQTPLAILQTKIDGLKKEQQYKGTAENLEVSLQHTSKFIHDLLRFARLESNYEEIQATTFDLSQTMNELVDEIQIVADSSAIRIERSISPDIKITSDESKLREVILNVASNAIKYMRESGERTISFSLSTTNGSVAIVVADTGIGIKQEDIEKIFQNFYRSSGSDLDKGTGLGLAICQKIIKNLGGEIAIKSTLGEGSTFTISVPIQP